MKITEKLANRLMIFGGVGMFMGLCVSIYSLFSSYNKASEDCNFSNCDVSMERVAAKLALVMIYGGAITMVIGIAIRQHLSSNKTK